MLKFQIALAIILVGCMAFLSCTRELPDLEMAEPVVDMPMEMPPEMPPEMPMEMIPEYKSWASVMLPAPMLTVDEAKAAMKPEETGQAHGPGPRTVYFNELGAMANATGGPYPAGTMIVKEIMDATDTSVITGVVTMTKTDDQMYDAYNGWIYGTPEPLEMAQGCHDCHAKASEIIRKPTDSVFVSLPMMDDTAMDEKKDETPMDEKKDETPMNGTNGNDAGDGNDNGDTQ